MKNILILCLLQIVVVLSIRKFNLTADFFKETYTRNAIIIDCFMNKKEQLNILKYFMEQGLRVSVFNIHYFNASKVLLNKHSESIVINADCESAANLLSDIGEKRLYASKYFWLVISKSLQVIKTFNKINLNVEADLTVAVSNEKNWTLIDIYNPSFRNGGRIRVDITGNYYGGNSSSVFRRTQPKYFKRRNMNEVRFKSQIVLPTSFDGSLQDYLLSDENRHINTFPRFHYRLLHHCQEYYGYSLNVSLSNSWGYKKSNGELDGVMGAEIKGDIDFPVAPLALREDRFSTVTYGRHTWLLRSAFIFRDKKATVSMNTFFKPLALPVWILTILSALLVSVMLKLIFKFEETVKWQPKTSWCYVFFVTVATFCQQGNYHNTSLISGRIVVGFTLILSVLIYQFYSGGIMSFLLMKPSTTIQTIADIDNSGMNVGCEDILYIRDFFNNSKDEILQKLYKKHTRISRNHSLYIPASIGINLVGRGNYAFDVDIATAYPLIEKTFSEEAICELQEVPLFVRQIFFYTRKYSPFKDMLNTCLHRLAECGLLQRQVRHWHPRKPHCISYSGYQKFNLSMKEVYPPFCVLFVGIIGSLLIVGIENMLRKLKQRIQPPRLLFNK